jgi:hypothetical protein
LSRNRYRHTLSVWVNGNFPSGFRILFRFEKIIITGVTKFDQVSVFSDLNQLIDLSLHREYAALCGITEEELLHSFRPEIDALAGQEGISYDECIERIREWYNGYRFHPDGPAVYNPFSSLNLFNFKEFQDFWFQTGTPTFLVELLKETDTDLREIEGIELPSRDFADYRADPDRPIPVIYQSGYLTIKGYNKQRFLYTLGYPNAEVRNGFLAFLLPLYSSVPDGVYVFEFKLNGTAEEALAQIDDKGYLIPYSAKTGNMRKLYKIGVEFDKEAKNISRWITQEE